MEAWERGLHLQLPLRRFYGAISGETERTTDVAQAATAITSLSRARLLEQPELPSTLSDTSVEDRESEKCDTRLATLKRDFPRLQEDFLQTKAHGKLVYAAGETSARVNSKTVT